jgi:putative nucleotidyltransferase with HDIG domain
MKLSILFVDDELNIIAGLKRMLHPLKKEWDLIFTNGGKEALELIESTPIDVVISDIRMPGIDGTQLLTRIKEKYPHIVRITLSGYANDNMALRNTRIVHQSLSKPTTPEIVKFTIENAYKLRQRLQNSELLSLINGIDDLPSLPEVYLKLEEEINSKNSSLDKLSKIISTDPIITAKILQLTNSAFFGLPHRISNMNQALNYLGINIIQNLVLTIKLFKSLDSKNPNASVYQGIWNHSNKVAFMAKQIAASSNLSKLDNEDSYLGGLLHDIGKIILLEKIEGIKIGADLKFDEYESKFSNITHADVGAYLLGIWGLPDSIVEAVAYHHSTENFEFNSLTPSSIVNLANRIVNKSDLIVSDIHKDNIEQLFNEYGQALV